MISAEEKRFWAYGSAKAKARTNGRRSLIRSKQEEWKTSSYRLMESAGWNKGAKAIFPKGIVQRCIVHLIRNSIKYIPTKDYKKFTQGLKKVYGAANLKAANAAFDIFCKEWDAVNVWKRNHAHVEQLYDYGSAVRKIMYTTNAIEAINSSFRKETKKGAFPNETALFKLLYLRISKLEKKWTTGYIANWSIVLNLMMVNDSFKRRIDKYIKH